MSSVTSKWAKGSGGPAGDECQNLTVFPCLRTNQRNNSDHGMEAAMLVTHTLTANGFDAGEDGTGRGTPLIAFNHQAGGSKAMLGISRTHTTALVTKQTPAIALQERNIATGLAVRRLTPRECERLQGWGDDHTRYRADGSEIADGPRYRLIGNGVAAPCAEWIGQRLMTV